MPALCDGTSPFFILCLWLAHIKAHPFLCLDILSLPLASDSSAQHFPSSWTASQPSEEPSFLMIGPRIALWHQQVQSSGSRFEASLGVSFQSHKKCLLFSFCPHPHLPMLRHYWWRLGWERRHKRKQNYLVSLFGEQRD